jgi:immunity protein 27 of polymorphic toxin system
MSEHEQRLNANEDSINGEWIFRDGKMVGDSNCKRIEWLIQHHLRKIADSIATRGWETLYRDPDDGRYWEKTYPHSEMHGGGPPRLQTIASEQVKGKYGAL